MTDAGRGVRSDEIAAGGWKFLQTDVWIWHDGFKNLRHFVPLAQGDWAKEDASGTSSLSYPFDGGTSRVSAEINPSATGTHRLRKRILLPRDYGTFAPTLPITLVVKRSGSVTSIKATLLAGGVADPGINGADVSPLASGTWETFTLTPSGSYNPGDYLTFEFEYVSTTIGVTADVADLQLSYKTNRGNV